MEELSLSRKLVTVVLSHNPTSDYKILVYMLRTLTEVLQISCQLFSIYI